MNQEKRDYCLNCIHKPCQLNGCPIKNRIPEFIKETDEEKAYKIVTSTSLLGAVCGRICPFSDQCEGVCTRGRIGEPVDIGGIEAEICDNAIKKGFKISKYINPELQSKSVAIIGGGPSGLECAGFLAREGVKVTIYEKHSELGGILTHGIPEFRLKKEITMQTINQILDLGIEVKYNQALGENLNIEELQNQYDAIYLAIGANEPNITLKGNNIYSANELLEYGDFPDFKDKKVIVNGGGNVAMDAARTIKHLGGDVTIVYRRSESEMPASKEEIEETKADKVKMEYLTNIMEYEKNMEDTGSHYLEHVREIGEAKGVNITTVLKKGSVADELGKYIEEHKIDALLVGMGQTPQSEMLERSFYAMLSHIKTSIIMVKSPIIKSIYNMA